MGNKHVVLFVVLLIQLIQDGVTPRYSSSIIVNILPVHVLPKSNLSKGKVDGRGHVTDFT